MANNHYITCGKIMSQQIDPLLLMGVYYSLKKRKAGQENGR